MKRWIIVAIFLIIVIISLTLGLTLGLKDNFSATTTSAPTSAPTTSAPTSAPTMYITTPAPVAPKPLPDFTHAPVPDWTQPPRACCTLYSTAATKSCPEGTLNEDAGMCYNAVTSNKCPDGFNNSDGRYCYKKDNVTCPSGYTWNGASSCTKPAGNLVCPDSESITVTTANGTPQTTTFTYTKNASDIVNCWAKAAPFSCPPSNPVQNGSLCGGGQLTNVCPYGYSNSDGTRCFKPFDACPAGSYNDGWEGNCITKTCPAGYDLNNDKSKCVKAAKPLVCDSGYTQVGASCYKAASNYCPDPTPEGSWQWVWHLLGASGGTTTCFSPAAPANDFCQASWKPEWGGKSSEWGGNGSGCCYNVGLAKMKCPDPGYKACPSNSRTSMPNCYTAALGNAANSYFPARCDNDGSVYDNVYNVCVRDPITIVKTPRCTDGAYPFGGNCAKDLIWSQPLVMPNKRCPDGTTFSSSVTGDYCAKPFKNPCPTGSTLLAGNCYSYTEPKYGNCGNSFVFENKTITPKWNQITGAGTACTTDSLCPANSTKNGLICVSNVFWNVSPVPKTWTCPEIPKGDQCNRKWDITAGYCTLNYKCK